MPKHIHPGKKTIIHSKFQKSNRLPNGFEKIFATCTKIS